MPATIKNLTEGTVSVPVVDYTFSRREVRYFEFIEFDRLDNDPVVKHLVSVGAIEITAEAERTDCFDPNELLFDSYGRLVYDSNEQLVTKG